MKFVSNFDMWQYVLMQSIFVSILILKLILIPSEFYLSAAVTKRYQWTQQDVQKFVGNSLQNALSRVRHSEKNRQAAEGGSYTGEFELENGGSNEDWRFT